MTLTIEEEQIFRKQIELMKFEQQLANIVLIQPVLTSSKDAEISILQQQIKAEEIHTKRSDYIKKVQPMKDNYRVLIIQNKQIEIDNKAIIDIARNMDESVKQEIFDSINIIRNELNMLLIEV